MSSRRSSRTQTTQVPTIPLTQSSSISSTSSSRAERVLQSPSTTPTSAEAMDSAEPETRQTRQRRREQEPLEEEQQLVDDDAVAEEGDDEEITRCLCRRQEYPGAPIPLQEANKNYSPKDAQAAGSPELAGDMFIQCDGCKVWQHGGCVGIMNESMSPEEYFCEECRKDLHKVFTSARGFRYSRYLPVYEIFNKPTRKSPPSKEIETRASRDPDTKAAISAAVSNAKKRSTMNSRAALDEEEALRKAIEESKAEGTGSTAGSSIRKGKRGREESEDTKQDLKRRKTASDPDSPPDAENGQGADSDEEGHASRSKSANGTKKSRAMAAQAQREKEKEQKEREKERERERAEAAGRRKGRAERRHADEVEAPEEAARSTPTVPAKNGSVPKMSRQATTPKIPASNPPATTASPSHRKNARTAPRRGRVGRNQYTKDRDLDDGGESPRPPHSRDGENGDDHAGMTNGRLAKAKPLNPARTSMNELKKRAAGMLEFISRTQVEMAGERTPPNGAHQPVVTAVATGTNRPGLIRTASVKGASKLRKEIDGEEVEAGIDEAAFQAMSSHEMLDVLTRRLVHWQKDHGKWGEKT